MTTQSTTQGEHALAGDGPSDASVARAEPIISAEKLAKSYGQAHAVRGISFAVQRGEVVGFLGPNGAGKSTTMKMLTGFLRPTSGRARIAGFDLSTHSLEARSQIGYLPESAPLYDEMMVIDFLRFIAELRELSGAHKAQRMGHVIERCGLQQVLGKDIGQLSRGYRQRVGLAQALVHDPALLILDEPTSGLDPNQIVEIRALIRDLGREKTVLLSTHILSEVQAVCSRAIIISDGQLVADDTPEALVRGGDAAAVAVTLRARDAALPAAEAMAATLQALPGVLSVQGVVSERHGHSFVVRAPGEVQLPELLFDAAVAHGWRIAELRQEGQSLEQTFQRLTRGTDADTDARGDKHAA